MFKSLKRLIAAGAAMSTVFTFAPAAVNAADATATVTIDTYLGDEKVDTVFVGENIKNSVSIQTDSKLGVADLVFAFDSSVIRLTDAAGEVVTTSSETFDREHGVEATANLTAKPAPQPTRFFVIPTSSNADDKHGYIEYSVYDIKKTFAEKTDILYFYYKVVGPESGEADTGFRFAENDIDFNNLLEATDGCLGGNIYELSGNPEGVTLYTSANSPIAVTKVNNAVKAYYKPEAPENFVLNTESYNLTWTAPSTGCRGYEITLFYDGEEKETHIVESSDLSFDFFNDLKAYGGGQYKYSIKAKGGTYDSDAVETAEVKIDGVPLDIPVMSFDSANKTASWTAVENAAKYTVKVYDLNSETPDEAFYTVDVLSLSADLSTSIGVGDYKIKVTAIPEESNKFYIASSPAEIFYSSGSLVKGKIGYLAGGQSVKNNCPAEVSLTDESKNVYKGNVDDNGLFEIPGVPEGVYTVKISRAAAITRTISDKLTVGDKSIEMTISKDNTGIKLRMGDISAATVGVFGDDLSSLLEHIGDDPVLDTEPMDMVKEDDGLPNEIGLEELGIIKANFGKATAAYRNLDDYKFN